MTTIAFDGFVLAADSLITNGDYIFGEAEKIHKLKDGRVFAAAGAQDFIYAVIDWLNGGEKPEIKECDSFIGLLLTPTDDGYDAHEVSQQLRIYPAVLPWAGGSGEPFALTAMKLGKSADEAVTVACKMDLLSGGKVTVNKDFDTR